MRPEMGFYERRILPALLSAGCSSKPVMKQRAKVVPRARGEVLEIGVGLGLNLTFYDPGRVTSVTGVDPAPALIERARAAPRAMPVDILQGVAEDLPLESGRFDTVVCTFTLCSVRDPALALAEFRRVLKPTGVLLFCEHGRSPDARLARWQDRWDPLWSRIAGGCHVNRPVTSVIEAAGFRPSWRDSMMLPGTPPIAAWNEWGEAVPA